MIDAFSYLEYKPNLPLFGKFIIKTLVDSYQGSYDPHYITGLGSLLWVLNHYSSESKIVSTALLQYIDYISEIKT